MGVKGLWRLLLPVGRRISIETLEGKVLAIDASIWLTQFLKAMRDPETGRSTPAAHLIGFCKRLAKLRFHGIRPVLVFDGPTPAIKLRELRQRRQRREQFAAKTQADNLQRLAKRLLEAELRKQKEKSSLGAYAPSFHPGQEEDEGIEHTSPLTANVTAVPETQDSNRAAESSEEILRSIQAEEWGKQVKSEEPIGASDWVENDEVEQYQPTNQQGHGMEDDIRLENLWSLPSNERKDWIEDAQRRQRMRSRREFMSVAGEPDQYSQVQVRNFLKSSKLNQRIVRMAQKESVRAFDSDGVPSSAGSGRRIFFEKYDEQETTTSKRPLKRKRHTPADSDSEVEWDSVESTDVPQNTMQSRARVVDDSSDSDEGGGFLNNSADAPSPRRGNEATEMRQRKAPFFASEKHPRVKMSSNFLSTKTDQEVTGLDDPAGDRKLPAARKDNDGDHSDQANLGEGYNTKVGPAVQQPSKENPGSSDSDDADDQIEWEDGANSDIEHSETEIDDLCTDDSSSSKVPKDLSLTRPNANQRSPSSMGAEKDRIGGKEQLVDEDNLSALARAQSTAANLADWAGRVFRRAIAEHTDERIRNNPPIGSQQTNDNVMQPSTSTRESEDDARSVDDAVVPSIGGRSAAGNSSLSASGLPGANTGENHDPEDRLTFPMLSEEVTGGASVAPETIADEMKSDIIKLIQLFGIPYVNAPAEAEAQCVALEKLGLVEGVVTEDSDAFVFGGQSVYKNIFDDQKYVELYRAQAAERDLGIGRTQFLALAMLLGGDYTEGVKGVGIVNGMEILQSFDFSQGVKAGLSQFRKWLDGFNPADVLNEPDRASNLTSEQTFHSKHRSARVRWIAPQFFPAEDVLNAYANPVVDTSKEKFTWGTPDLDGLVTFCERCIGWEAAETRALLKPMLRRVEEGMNQTRLDSYFMKYEDDIKFASVKSKRLRSVFSSMHNSQGPTAN